jgi:hypothetical protein
MSWTQVTPMNEGLPISAANPLPVTQSSSEAGGAATSDNQLSQIAILEDILTNQNVKAIRLDQVTDNLFYVGKAQVGSTDSDANWQIVRYTRNGAILRGEFANGSEDFNQVWNDRTTINYI